MQKTTQSVRAQPLEIPQATDRASGGRGGGAYLESPKWLPTEQLPPGPRDMGRTRQGVGVLVTLLAAVAAAAASGSCENVGAVPSGLHPGVEELLLQRQSIVNLTSLSGYPDLKRISLGDNLLSSLPLSTFQGAEGVQEIEARDNRIRAVLPAPEGVLFPSLAVLDLSNNQIEGLAEGDLRGVSALEELRLARNPLRALPPEALAGRVAKGAVVLLDDTPLACACALSDELREWALLKGVRLSAECLGADPCERLRAPAPP